MPLTNIRAKEVCVLTSLVNCDSAWKVPKGRRSALRRPKNIAGKSLKNCEGVICGGLKQCKMLASESKKNDKSVLGGHLSDRAEQVPFKKRRFFLQSRSIQSTPQPVITFSHAKIAEHSESQDPSSNFEVNRSSNDINFNEIAGNINNNHDEKSENASEHFVAEEFSGKSTPPTEDHSCVEGCSTQKQIHEISTSTEKPSLPGGLPKEELVNSSEISTRTLSCLSVEPIGDLASLPTVNSPHKVEADGSGIETGSSGLGSVILPSNDTCRKDEKTVEIQMSSSRGSRLHWDLNLEMDSWEQCFDDSEVIQEHPLKYHEDEKIRHHDKTVRFERYDSRDELTTTFTEHNSLQEIPADPALEGNKEKAGMVDDLKISHPVSLDDKPELSHYNGDLDSANCVIEGVKYVHHLESFDNGESVLNHGVIPTKCAVADEDEVGCPVNLKFGGGSQSVIALESWSPSVVASSSEVEKQTDRVNLCADIQPSAGVLSTWDIREDVAPSVPVASSVFSEDISFNESLGNAHVDISSGKGIACSEAPNVSVSKFESLGILDSTKVQHGCSFLDEKLDGKKETTKECCNSVYNDACGANMDNPTTSDKIDSAEDHGYANDTDLNANVASVVEVSAENNLQVDYDSQYEDGELRETSEYICDEYHEDNEAEYVDYGEEDMDICTTSPTRVHVFEVHQVDNRKNVIHSVSKIENDVSRKAAKHGRDKESRDGNDEVKSSHQLGVKTNASRSQVLSKSSTEMATEVKENLRNNANGTESRIGSNTYRKSLRSKIEGPVLHDASSREERSNHTKSRYDDPSCTRSFERFQYRGRGYRRGGISDGRRTFKHHSTRPFNVDGVVDREDIRGHNSPKFTSSGRERSHRYGQRADRERYGGTASKDEIFQSSLKHRRPLSHRERSLSPIGVRGQHNSRGKSPSRSRSRSPLTCHLQRGIPGNTFLRLGPTFAADDDAMDFRNGISPPHRRWVSDQKEDLVELNNDFGCNKQRISAFERVRERHPFRNIKRGGFNPRFSEDNRRKHYDHPVDRHNYKDIGSNVRRFHQDGSDNQERESSGFQVRGIQCRIGDLARRLRGEKHGFVYERDGKLDSNLNQFGTDVVASSK